MIKQGGQDMEPIFTDKQLNNMSREDLISLMKIVQEQTKKKDTEIQVRMQKQKSFLKRSGHPLINVKKEKERRKKTFPILRPLRPGLINWKGKPVTVRNAEKNTA